MYSYFTGVLHSIGKRRSAEPIIGLSCQSVQRNFPLQLARLMGGSEVSVLKKGPVTLFLGAGASACECFPTVLQFFEHVNFPDGVDARGFKTASMELARRISIAE